MQHVQSCRVSARHAVGLSPSDGPCGEAVSLRGLSGGNLGPDPSETPNVVQKTAQLLSAWSCWQQTSEGALFCSVCLLDLPLFGERSVSSCLANFCWLPALFLMYEGRQQRRDPVRNCYWLPNPNRFFLQFFCKFYARSQLWILRSSQ